MIQIVKNSLFIKLFILFFVSGVIYNFFIEKGDVFLWVNRNNEPVLDILFKYVTYMGDALFVLLIALILAFFHFGRGFLTLISLVVAGGTAQLLKKLVFPEELRPSGYFADLDLHIVDNVNVHTHYSFPSGHTATAFALFCLLSLMFYNKKLGFMFFILAVAVGFSRIYLAQHFYDDVLAGSLIGVLSAILLFRYVFQRPNFMDSKIANASFSSIFNPDEKA